MRLACLFFALALVGCAEIQYAPTGGGAGGSGVGGASTTASGGMGGAADGGAGAMGGAGGAPCVPTGDETCNGLDDDCNGVTDDPPGGAGQLCSGCTWLSHAGKLYVACAANMAPIDSLECPGGTELVVLQDAAEQSALSPLVPGALEGGYVNLRQADLSPHLVSSWSWGGREGMPPAWGNGQPDDYDKLEPVALENDQEQCAALYRLGSVVELADVPCDGFAEYFLCEQTAPGCIAGTACLVAEGCKGVFDCDLPEGAQCVASPANETCNGLDDNCDGSVDDASCSCVAFSGPAGGSYKRCLFNTQLKDAQCGPGYRLAFPNDAAELSLLSNNLGGGDRWWGAYQPTDETAIDGGWRGLDGTPVSLTVWNSGQPDDGNQTENGFQQCVRVTSGGASDESCSAMYGYLCEEL